MLGAAAVGIAVVCAGGCYGHYAVTDAYTQRLYFTRRVETKEDGTRVFRNERSGDVVTLRHSSVRPISTEEFNRGIGK